MKFNFGSNGNSTGGLIIFLIMSIVMTVLFFLPLRAEIRKLSWEKGSAEITGYSEITPARDSGHTMEVFYSYQAGQTDFNDKTSQQGSIAKLSAYRKEHPVGSRIPCHINLERPTEHTVQQPSLLFAALFPLLPLLFVGISLALLINRLRKRKKVPEPAGLTGSRKYSHVLVGLLVTVFVLAIAIPLIYFFCAKPLLLTMQARHWVETPASVVSSRVGRSDDSDGVTYRVEIAFRYIYENQEYLSDRYEFSETYSSGRRGKQKIVDRYPPGREIHCFVNPRNPAEAVIDRSLPVSVYIGGAFIPVLLIVFAIVIIISLRSHKRRQNFFSSPTAWGKDPADFQPKREKKHRLFGGIFTLAFNIGVWWGLIFTLSRQIWVGAFILAVFAATGLLLLALLIAELPNAFRATARLELDRPARLGEELLLRWSCPAAKNTRQLVILLQGSLRYTDPGKDKSSDSSSTYNVPFHFQVLHQEEDPRETMGEVKFVLPPDTMHTLPKDTSSGILWTIKIIVIRNKFFYSTENFKLTVLPGGSTGGSSL